MAGSRGTGSLSPWRGRKQTGMEGQSLVIPFQACLLTDHPSTQATSSRPLSLQRTPRDPSSITGTLRGHSPKPQLKKSISEGNASVLKDQYRIMLEREEKKVQETYWKNYWVKTESLQLTDSKNCQTEKQNKLKGIYTDALWKWWNKISFRTDRKT